MAINDFIIGAQLITAGTAASGSFAKLQVISGSVCVGAANNEAHFETISFGHATTPESAHTASVQLTAYTHSLDSFTDPNIQGPIARFKVDRGNVLAYFTKQ